MSKAAIDFLRNSFLFYPKALYTAYADYSDEEIVSEVEKYKKAVRSSEVLLNDSVSYNSLGLRVSIERLSAFPDENTIKQLLLYMDQIVIPDPLVDVSFDRSQSNRAFEELLGLNSDGSINRERIKEAVASIANLQKAIEMGVVFLSPTLSDDKDVKEEVPLTYSPTAFSGVLPQDVEKYYQANASVYNVFQKGGRLCCDTEAPLVRGNIIRVSFDEDDTGVMYLYTETSAVDAADNHISIRLSPDVEMSEQTFNHWVFQSINQAAIKHFQKTVQEIVFSINNQSIYMCQRKSTAGVLKMFSECENKRTSLANLAFNLDIPVIENIPINTILDIRANYGDAFYSFRSSLNERLNKIDTGADEETIRFQLKEIEYDLMHTEIEKVKQSYRKIRKSISHDLIILAGTLAFSAFDNSMSMYGAMFTTLKSVIDIGRYYTDIHSNPGFFMWNIDKQHRKRSI